MKRIAIYVEGDSEKHFIFNLLFLIFPSEKLKINSVKLGTSNNFQLDTHTYESPNPEYEIQLINANNDTKVVSAIFNNADRMFSNGFDHIIGLRDIYSQEYESLSRGVIKSSAVKKVIEASNKTLDTLSNRSMIQLHFSVMEFESWYFNFLNSLELNGYSIKKINSIIGMDLNNIDPELEFYNPKLTMKEIHKAIKNKPFKVIKLSESMISKITQSDIDDVLKKNRAHNLKKFLKHLKSLV